MDASVPPAPPEPELRVEDHRVTSSGHGVLGYPGSYRRLHVVCKFHRGCGAQRSFSTKLARWAGVPEEHEPLCFLGAWLKKGRDLDTKAAHMKYRKTMEAKEVRAYADALACEPVVPESSVSPMEERRVDLRTANKKKTTNGGDESLRMEWTGAWVEHTLTIGCAGAVRDRGMLREYGSRS